MNYYNNDRPHSKLDDLPVRREVEEGQQFFSVFLEAESGFRMTSAHRFQ